MIFLFFAFEGIFIPGITIYGDRLFTGSYNTTIVDSTLIDLIGSPVNALDYAGGVDVYSYGGPYALTQVKALGGRSVQTSVFINGIPVNDVKTGVFDMSLLNGNITGIEVLKGGLILPGVNSTMGTGINYVKRPESKFRVSLGGYGYLGAGVGYEKNNDGFTIDFSRYRGFRSNQDGYSGGFDVFFKNLFITGTLKKTGVPGPYPGKTVPPYGDSTAYSIYDTQEDRFFAFSYNTRTERYQMNIYGIYSRMLPYSRYIDYFSGNEVEERDDYRTYSAGITGFYTYSTVNTGFSMRIDSAAFFRPDTTWGKLTYAISVSPSLEKMFSNHAFFGSGFNIDIGKATGRVWSSYMVAGYRKGFEVYVKGSRDFRKPTINELYWPLFSNPDLKPEVSKSIEAGFRNDKFSITGYYRDVADMIGYNASFIPVNINRAYIKGIDVALNYSISNVKITLTYNWVKGVERLWTVAYYDSLNNPVMDTFYIPLEYTPENRASVMLYTLKDPNIFVGVKYRDYMVRYVRSMGTWIIYNLPSYLVIDAGIVKKLGDLKVRFIITNILDTEQRVWFGYTPDTYYLGEPRSFRLEVMGRI